MKVGLSLSFCVRDIMVGKVALTDVKFISSNTRCTNAADWNECIAHYQQWYWKENPVEAERIARHFIDRALVLQPRLEGKYMWGSQTWIEESEYNQWAAEHLRSERGDE